MVSYILLKENRERRKKITKTQLGNLTARKMTSYRQTHSKIYKKESPALYLGNTSTEMLAGMEVASTSRTGSHLLIQQSSATERANMGTEGKSRRASFTTHSRYRSFFKSSTVTGRSVLPGQTQIGG